MDLKNILYFTAGAISGGVGVYIVLARKFEKDFQEITLEINEEMKRLAEERIRSVEDDSDSGDSGPHEGPDPEHLIQSYSSDLPEASLEDVPQEVITRVVGDRQHMEAYRITEEEFLAPNHQEHMSINYYLEDDVFADSQGIPLQNTSWFDNIISEVTASDSIVYIRSMMRNIDFEVTIIDDSYESSVLGVQGYDEVD